MKIQIIKVAGGLAVFFCIALIANIIIPNISYKSEVEVTKFIIEDGKSHPLIVVFGGSEGGDSFKGSSWAPQSLQKLGFSVISIAYFGADNAPPFLKEISLNKIMESIKEVTSLPEIENQCLSLIGGSRGGELVLLLASLYKEVDLVVAFTPSFVVYPAVLVSVPQKSAWQYNQRPVPFLPTEQFTYIGLKAYLTGNGKAGFLRAMENSEDVKNAIIKVEKIQGPILLMSGKYDEAWPSFEMSNKIVERLKKNSFQYDFEHIAQDTGHLLLKHPSTWRKTLAFLDEQINEKKICSKKYNKI